MAIMANDLPFSSNSFCLYFHLFTDLTGLTNLVNHISPQCKASDVTYLRAWTWVCTQSQYNDIGFSRALFDYLFLCSIFKTVCLCWYYTVSADVQLTALLFSTMPWGIHCFTI